jgi:hypothetical protein
MVHLL